MLDDRDFGRDDGIRCDHCGAKTWLVDDQGGGLVVKGLRLERVGQKLSLRDLEALAGVPCNHISLYERGLRGMRLDTACALAQALGVTLDYLVRTDPVRVPGKESSL